MADIQTQVLYPPSVLLRWLPLPAFFTWGLVFHLWVLGFGVFAICRQLGTTRVAGLAAAAGVVLSGAIAPKIYAGHLVVLSGYAWFPLALALAIRSASRVSIWPHPALVGVLVIHVLAGFLQGTVYVCAVIGLYFVYAALRPATGAAWWHPLVQAVVLFTLVFALAGFQLLPTARLALEAGRATGGGYGFASENAFALGDLVTAVFPNALGLRRELWDSSLFVTVGLLACVPLAWADPARRRPAWFALGMAVAALGLAMADTLPLYRVHHALLPQFRGPTRLLFFWTIGVAVLGGLGLDTLLRRLRDSAARTRLLAWVPALAGVLLLGLAMVQAGGTGSTMAVRGTPYWLVAIQLVGLASLAVMVRQRRSALAGAVIVLLVTTEGLVFATPLVQVREHPRLTVLGRLAAHDPSRVVSLCERTISPSDLVAAGIPTTDGFGSISLGRYTRFLGLVQTGDLGGITRRLGQDSEDLPVRLDLLDSLHVSHVITCRSIVRSRWRLVDRLDGTYLYENAGVRPRAVLTCDTEPRSSEAVMLRLERSRYDAAGRLVSPPPQVNIRWAEETTEADRVAGERRYGLVNGRLLLQGPAWDGRTWQYGLLDVSAANVGALVSEPRVEDTHGIDRSTARVVPVEVEIDVEHQVGPTSEQSRLVDGSGCDVQGTVEIATMDRADGVVRLTVETAAPALVFFSEPHYPERRVWVDGEERPLERVNVAFSGVRVGPGRHVVELRFVAASFRWGMLLSVVALAGWIGTATRWGYGVRAGDQSSSCR